MFETKLGFAGIAWSDDGITRFRLPDPDRAAAERQFGKAAAAGRRRRMSRPWSSRPSAILPASASISRRSTSTSPASIRSAAPIYDALRKVGFGETVTYGELAKRAGVNAPQAAQDVGVAMARNPVPLIIPCHRVLAAGGKLGGFSAPGRTETKENMLALEGVFIGGQPRLL